MRTALGTPELGRRVIGTRRAVPGGARGDAVGDVEKRAGATGSAAPSHASICASEGLCSDGDGGGRAEIWEERIPAPEREPVRPKVLFG